MTAVLKWLSDPVNIPNIMWSHVTITWKEMSTRIIDSFQSSNHDKIGPFLCHSYVRG